MNKIQKLGLGFLLMVISFVTTPTYALDSCSVKCARGHCNLTVSGICGCDDNGQPRCTPSESLINLIQNIEDDSGNVVAEDLDSLASFFNELNEKSKPKITVLPVK